MKLPVQVGESAGRRAVTLLPQRRSQALVVAIVLRVEVEELAVGVSGRSGVALLQQQRCACLLQPQSVHDDSVRVCEELEGLGDLPGLLQDLGAVQHRLQGGGEVGGGLCVQCAV